MYNWFLTILLVTGYIINKKIHLQKNEIRNLEKQILTKNQQLSNIQRNFIKNKENINDLINPDNINFLKVFRIKKLKI